MTKGLATMSTLTIPIEAIAQALAARPEITEAVSSRLAEVLTLSHVEAAKALGVGREFFRTVTDAPGGPPSVVIGKLRRWRLKELIAWLESLESSRATAMGMSTKAYNKLKSKPVEQVQPPKGFPEMGRQPKTVPVKQAAPSGYQTFGRKPKGTP